METVPLLLNSAEEALKTKIKKSCVYGEVHLGSLRVIVDHPVVS